jgi:hypothetical protein
MQESEDCHHDEGFSPRRDLFFVRHGNPLRGKKQIPRRPEGLLVMTTFQFGRKPKVEVQAITLET